MLLLQVNNISKTYGANSILKQISLQVGTGDRIGMIGANGAGKTTLLRCIMGEELPDTGDIKITDGICIGYLQQNTEWTASGTIWGELMDVFNDILELKDVIDQLANKMTDTKLDLHETEQLMNEYGELVDRFECADGYNLEVRVRRVARGLGFTEHDNLRELCSLSGGERTRLALAKLLLRNPALLLLDEPTNHLDIQMVEWLEEFLADYRGGIIVISHDRYFLDRVTNKTLAIEAGKGVIYPGNYSQFALFQEAQKEAAQRAFAKQQKWIEKTEAFVDRYRAGIKAKQARGRLSQLNRLERLQEPAERELFGDIVFEPSTISGERVLDLKNIQLAYGDRSILTNVTMSIRKGEGVALVGPNGAGKTSLLKIINGIISPVRGSIRLGAKVKIGYFTQHHENLTLSNKILDEIMSEFGLTENVSRKYLAVFLFQGDDVLKHISELSGGERARLVMLKLLLSNANFLILDEPTNHLDIPSKEAFEKALQNYTGTFLVVSHDRYFLDRVINRVLALDNGVVQEYVGDYTYFQNKKREQEVIQNNSPAKLKVMKDGKSHKEKRERVNYTKLIAQTEKEIASLEEEIKSLETTINEGESGNDYEKLKAISAHYHELTMILNEKIELWEFYMHSVNE